MRRIHLTEDIRPLSEFRAGAAECIAQVRSSKRPLVITQRGKSAAVLLDVEVYEDLMDRLELVEDIRVAEEQLARGEGIEEDEVFRRIQERIQR
ncbi:MAG: type II toxin-antitoxin system Phd/YefM family antitoxin [Thermodesulfobacteriota bacterium]